MIKILFNELKKVIKEPFVMAVLLVATVLTATFLLQVYGFVTSKQQSEPVTSIGEVAEFEMVIAEGTWEWDPDVLRVNEGQAVKIDIDNEDSFAHGFAIPELGVDEYLPGSTVTTVEFTATESGEYRFECSVLCGAGHVTQRGVLIVE